ncbi:alpha-ketoglutarate-dependent dioxygenase AlkB family protein [Marivirga arenosa]|uniref:Alpha-ketoglutarate-dependent dioxygenase AlkB n=1 Tax=Marivirga arenosa TaxID=3059076 RepID=A0AA52F118_9BACT|nr:alpha-ketoglutarate-dependent dioxygenase AlkB [Marivirga sp. BKB1-2]WNB18623.1 alpha-ketoglutarate-dependent dioxygenase AlkB [Marivirga sp. BKB1-2]
MKLFSDPYDPNKNILPHGGIVQYHGQLFSQDEALFYFQSLMNEIDWEHDKAIIFGKEIITKRKVAWYADQAFSYTYSKVTKTAKIWTPELQEIKSKVEQQLGETFNSCLLNLYHSGEEGMAWHSDGEKDLKDNGAIASVSFGAERKFAFKHKETKEKLELILEDGSLLMMGGSCQKNWLHRLPPTKKVQMPRINLTFRTIVNQ